MLTMLNESTGKLKQVVEIKAPMAVTTKHFENS
jgi:hypothetical protein